MTPIYKGGGEDCWTQTAILGSPWHQYLPRCLNYWSLIVSCWWRRGYPTSTKLEGRLMHRGHVFHPRGHFAICPTGRKGVFMLLWPSRLSVIPNGRIWDWSKPGTTIPSAKWRLMANCCCIHYRARHTSGICSVTGPIPPCHGPTAKRTWREQTWSLHLGHLCWCLRPRRWHTHYHKQSLLTKPTSTYGTELCKRECTGVKSSQVWSFDHFFHQTSLAITCLHSWWVRGHCGQFKIKIECWISYSSLPFQCLFFSEMKLYEGFFNFYIQKIGNAEPALLFQNKIEPAFSIF